MLDRLARWPRKRMAPPTGATTTVGHEGKWRQSRGGARRSCPGHSRCWRSCSGLLDTGRHAGDRARRAATTTRPAPVHERLRRVPRLLPRRGTNTHNANLLGCRWRSLPAAGCSADDDRLRLAAAAASTSQVAAATDGYIPYTRSRDRRLDGLLPPPLRAGIVRALAALNPYLDAAEELEPHARTARALLPRALSAARRAGQLLPGSAPSGRSAQLRRDGDLHGAIGGGRRRISPRPWRSSAVSMN